MRNFKRFAALTMASVMVLGSTVTAFAAGNEGSLGGTGTSTGHLDTTFFKVQLPTVASNATTFDYFADPEGHIAATGYSNTGVEIASNNDGVYFLNAGSEVTEAAVSSYSITVGGSAATSGLTITGLSESSDAEGVYTYNNAGKWVQDTDELADTLVIKKVSLYTPDDGDSITVAGGEVTACSFDHDTAVANYSVAITDPLTPPDDTYLYTSEDGWQGNDDDDVTLTITSITKTETITPAENDTITLVAYAAGGDAGYSSTSDALTVTNMSNVDADITATVTVTANDHNMALAASKDALADVDAPTLYLGLKLGDTETAIESTGATKTVLVEGVDGYEEIYDSGEGKYVMAEKETHDAWETTTISLTGKVASTAVTEEVVAPAINVTWSYAKHTEAETEEPHETQEPEITEPTASAESVAVGGSVNILLPEGVTISEVQKRKNDGSFNTLSTTYYTLDDIDGGKKLTVASNLLSTYSAATQIKVVFSSGDPITLNVTAQ